MACTTNSTLNCSSNWTTGEDNRKACLVRQSHPHCSQSTTTQASPVTPLVTMAAILLHHCSSREKISWQVYSHPCPSSCPSPSSLSRQCSRPTKRGGTRRCPSPSRSSGALFATSSNICTSLQDRSLLPGNMSTLTTEEAIIDYSC